MSKWKFWKKVMKHEHKAAPSKDVCSYCGKHVLRQSKLSEFADMTPENQTRLTDFSETTQRVGMRSQVRKYRGSI